VHHVLTVDATGTKVYVDGALEGEKVQAGLYATIAARFQAGKSAIGRHWWSGGTSTRYTGMVDDVRIYNRALSAAEVTDLYNAETPAGQKAPRLEMYAAAQEVVVGNNATLKASANGADPLTYQWRKDGVDIDGATSATYNITNAQASHNGSYSVVVSNVYGNATSSDGNLRVYAPGEKKWTFATGGDMASSPAIGTDGTIYVGSDDKKLYALAPATAIDKLWDKRFGGSTTDQLNSVIATADGGYLLAGTSSSSADGDKSEATRGGSDFWAVKIDANGAKVWDKRFGGS